MADAWVGLGANLDDPVRQLRRAVQALRNLDQVGEVRVSSLYRSRPEDGSEQPDYYNAAAALITRLEPTALLRNLMALEAAAGRRRSGARGAARPLDLDLLLYDDLRMHTTELELPHPRFRKRAFVLAPLAEIAPEVRDPDTGRTLAALSAAMDLSAVTRVAGPEWAGQDMR